jgi:LuxR family maltose regulon positive regulatory protein
LADADELQARIRLALGDHTGAMRIAEQLPDTRRAVVSSVISARAGDVIAAEKQLQSLAVGPLTIRSEVELELLRAEVAVLQPTHQTPRLVRNALDMVERHGFVQTVLETAPHLVEHLLSESDRYPRSEHLTALAAAAIDARQSATRPHNGQLADPLTDAEIKVLQKLPQRLTYADIAYDMHLSLNTVKTHLRHTYMKLGVSSRSAAVKRAAALGFV